jgi:two-component system NtrC family sensor kinase
VKRFGGGSLRRNLSALITLLALSIVVVVNLTLIRTRNHEFARELERKATLYARLMSSQLEAAVAFEDRQTAREVFASMRLDGDIISIGLYRESGRMIQGSGPAEPAWKSLATKESLDVGAERLEAVAPVRSREGPRGTLVLALGTARFARLEAEALRGSMLVGLGAAALALILSWVIAGTVVKRLQRIAQVAGRVAEGDLTQPELPPGRLDEIGRLTRAFNAMLSHLQRLMRQQHETAASEQERLNLLVATRTEELRRETDERKRSEALVAETRIRDARSAGMAEVATGVLHNVGNALNSVGVSAEMIGDMLRRSRLPGLAKANTLIGAHAADLASFLTEHPQGKQLPGYLAKIGIELSQQQEEVVRELDGMRKGLAHITSIVSTQQSLAKGAGRNSGREPIAPRAVFEEALALGLPVSERSSVKLSLDFPETGPVTLDRHRLIQILVNLIGNATQALAGVLPEERRLELSLAVAAGRVRFSVRENGVGIPPELRVKIFSHGFTTKKDGHGFGLHASACAAMEMGGTLTCHSDGAGKGSTFTIDLPIAGDAKLKEAA